MKIARPDGSVLSNVDISVVDRRVSVKSYTYPFSVSIDNASTIDLVRIAWNQGVLFLPIPFYIRRTQMTIYLFSIITSLVRFFSEQEAADHLVSLLLLVLLLLHRVRREGGMKMARMIYM